MTNEQQPADQGRGVESRESRMVVIERNAEGTPTIWCDPEIVDLVTALNAGGIPTVASCSGHGAQRGNIALRDGRELHISPDFESARTLEAAIAALTQPKGDAPYVPGDGEVLVTVSGLTGSGKSGVAGEIEILCKALGLQVEWKDSGEEKRLTYADWTHALELYKPRVTIIEQNIPRKP
jgi:hypothetical protein